VHKQWINSVLVGLTFSQEELDLCHITSKASYHTRNKLWVLLSSCVMLRIIILNIMINFTLKHYTVRTC